MYRRSMFVSSAPHDQAKFLYIESVHYGFPKWRSIRTKLNRVLYNSSSNWLTQLYFIFLFRKYPCKNNEAHAIYRTESKNNYWTKENKNKLIFTDLCLVDWILNTRSAGARLKPRILRKPFGAIRSSETVSELFLPSKAHNFSGQAIVGAARNTWHEQEW